MRAANTAKILTALVVSLGLVPPLMALPQEPTTDWRTPDGTRFVLVPTQGAPVVHWVVATPAGALEDPLGFEGLAFAVARAAMFGTGPAVGGDPVAEQAALAELDQLEQAFDQATGAGRAIPDPVQAALARARERTAALHDHLAWQRELLRSPAVHVQLHQTAGGCLLQLTTVPGAVPRIAQLLVERREGQTLRGVPQELRSVRAAFDAEQSGPAAEMRREVLGLGFLGHALSRATGGQTVPVSSVQALEVFRRTHHPMRTTHVLVGGFDPDEVRTQLHRAFARTALPPVRLTPPPTMPANPIERQSRVPPGPHAAVTIGFRLAADLDPDDLAILVQWLAGGAESELARRLRLHGHREVQVRGEVPYPAGSSGLMLVEIIEDATGRGRGQDLSAGVEACLEEILQDEPGPAAIERAVAAVGAARAPTRLGAESLALHLALAVGLSATDLALAMRDPRPPSVKSLTELIRRVLPRGNRVVVTMDASR